jgi:prephenate dehydrogenase
MSAIEQKLRGKLSEEDLELALKLLSTPISKIRKVIEELAKEAEKK